MQLLWLSLFLCLQISGISRSLVINQSPESLVVQTNKEAKILCEIRSSKDDYGIYWLRQVRSPDVGNPFEFLVHSRSKTSPTYGEGVDSEKVLASSEAFRSTLRLLNLKPSDSGTYICAIIEGPALVFGKGTWMNVVDALPTTPTTTKKTIPKKKLCNTKPSDVSQKNGPLCSILPLSLLMGCAVVLLIPLIVVIRLNYLWHLARHHFVKQLQR